MTRLHRVPSDFATPKVRDSFVSKFVYETEEDQVKVVLTKLLKNVIWTEVPHGKNDQSQEPYSNNLIIKLTNGPNKLECLSLESLSSLVLGPFARK